MNGRKSEESNTGLLTTKEVAEILRVNDCTVQRWVKHGLLAAICAGNPRAGYLFRRQVIDDILEPGGKECQ